MRADIAESIRHDVVTDNQYILEVVPFRDERWSTDEPMTLEELTAWIGQPDLKTPMSQTLVDALGHWFVYGSDRKELSKDQVESLRRCVRTLHCGSLDWIRNWNHCLG